MIKKRFLDMPKELENKIVELAHTIKRLGLNNLDFEHYDEKVDEVYKVYITEYKEFWEIVHACDGYANVSSSKRDMYEMKFDENKLTYTYSEED